MKKKKLDEFTKTKLIYSGELVLFAIVFLVLAILQTVGVINYSETFLNIFKFVTLIGVAYFVFDIVTTFTNKRKREKACLVDKFSTIIIPPYLLVVDILFLSNNEFIWNNPKFFITPLFFYISLVYAFQGIYHWFFPLKELFEDDEKEEKKDDANVVDVQTPEIVDEEVKEETKEESNEKSSE